MAHVSSWRRSALGFGVWMGRAEGLDLKSWEAANPVRLEACQSGMTTAIGRALKCRTGETKLLEDGSDQMISASVQKNMFGHKRHYNAALASVGRGKAPARTTGRLERQ